MKRRRVGELAAAFVAMFIIYWRVRANREPTEEEKLSAEEEGQTVEEDISRLPEGKQRTYLRLRVMKFVNSLLKEEEDVDS